MEKVGQKEQGLLPSKNYELTVSNFRARTREKNCYMLEGMPILGQREGRTHFHKRIAKNIIFPSAPS